MARSQRENANARVILVVGPITRNSDTLRSIVRDENWSLSHARTTADAVDLIESEDIAVVFFDCESSDEDWRHLLARLETVPVAPNLIVTSRIADERLWAEVLNLGGFDLLQTPFDRDEVIRVIENAWFDRERRVRQRPPPCRSMPHGALHAGFVSQPRAWSAAAGAGAKVCR